MSKEFPIKKKTYPSGLRTVLLPRSEGETVTFMVLVGVGSRYETPKQGGLSHFLEHMFFKGTKKRPDKKEIAETLDRVGAEFNAFTSEELTAFYVKVAKEHLMLGADVVTDILLGSLFPAEEIEKEKGVIIEEIKMYTDNPGYHVHHLWYEALFGNHPLGRRIDGREETVKAFGRSDFTKYTSKHYHTKNVVVAAAGNFDPVKCHRLIGKLFAGLASGVESQPMAAPMKMPRQKFVFERRESLDQTHLMVGVPGLAMDSKDRYAADLLAVVLGGGMSSRLFDKIREENGLAYSVRTGSENFADTGSFVTQAGLRTDQAPYALELISQEYDRVREEEVGQAELDKAKQMIRGRLVMGLEETNSMAVFAGGQELLTKKVLSPEEIWTAIAKVTSADIKRVAGKLLDRKFRSAALLGPQKSTKVFEKLII